MKRVKEKRKKWIQRREGEEKFEGRQKEKQ